MKEQPLLSNFRWCLSTLSILFLPLLGQSQVTLQFRSSTDDVLIGVTVEQVGGNWYGVSDIKGEITIPTKHLPMDVMAKYLGYEDATLRVDVATEIQIVRLNSASTQLQAIEIIGRTQESSASIPQSVDILNRQAIRQSQSQSSADLLANTGTIFVQKSQAGGGSPIVRGFEANKVLLVVDGVRLNNAIYRGGHLQNAITVDHSSLESLEVIYGSGSLMYGSDALGGVLHFTTLKPNYWQKPSGEVSYQFASANLGQRLSANFRAGNAKCATATSISLSKFGDFEFGSRRRGAYADSLSYGISPRYFDEDGILTENFDPYVQPRSGYSQIDVLQKLKFSLGKVSDLTFNGQFSTSTNIVRNDQLSLFEDGLPLFKKWEYGPQKRLLLSTEYATKSATKWYDSLQAIAAFQAIEETRIVQSTVSPFTDTNAELVNVYSLTLDLSKAITKYIKLQYGADLHYNTVDSEGSSMTDDGITRDIFSRYPAGGNTLLQTGAFAQAVYRPNAKWIVSAGSRINRQVVALNFTPSPLVEWPNYFYDGIKNTTSAIVNSLSISRKWTSYTLRYSASQGFRSPNVDDLAKIRVKSDEITIPNPQLGPENTFSQDLTLARSKGKLSGEASLYLTLLSDVILRQAYTLPNGDDTYTDSDGTIYRVTANVNGQSGSILGGQMRVKYTLSDKWSMTGRIAYTKGLARIGDDSKPLAHIPPIYGLLGVRYALATDWDINCQYRFFGDKSAEDYGDSEDNLEYALEDGTPSYGIWTISSQKQFSGVKLNVALDNLLDTFYRPFSSGVNGQGCSINLGVSLLLD